MDNNNIYNEAEYRKKLDICLARPTLQKYKYYEKEIMRKRNITEKETLQKKEHYRQNIAKKHYRK